MSKIIEDFLKLLGTDPIYFVIAPIILLTALLAVLQTNLVRAGFCLICCFGSLAVLYFALSAQLVAVSQILIYTVGITLLIIFAVMLLADTRDNSNINLGASSSDEPNVAGRQVVALLISSSIFIVLSSLLSQAYSSFKLGQAVSATSQIRQDLNLDISTMSANISALGKIMLGSQVLAFEGISLLLLAVFVAAILISKRELPR